MDRYHSFYDTPIPPTVRKAIGADSRSLSFTTLLTYPSVDLAGDYVNPEGGDYGPHIVAGGVIDLEHGRTAQFRRTPVASAFDSLWEPGGNYCVYLKALNFAPDGETEEIYTVPIGREHYDRNLRHSMQVFAMREQGVRMASSLEFEPDWKVAKALGQSPLEDRPAYDFPSYRVHRWTVCRMGVNPGALVGKSIPSEQVPQFGHKILRDRRVLIGANYEPLCPLILKAFDLDDPRRTNRSIVRVESKAMPTAPVEEEEESVPAEPQNEPELETANEEAMSEESGGQGIASFYKHADTLRMLAEEARADAEKTDNPKVYKDLLKIADELEAIGKKCDGHGDRHDAALMAAKNGNGVMEEEEEEPEEEPEEEEEDEPDMEMDEDGVRKSLREPYKIMLKALKVGTPVKQFPREQLQGGVSVAKAKSKPNQDTDPEASAVLADFIALKNRIGV